MTGEVQRASMVQFEMGNIAAAQSNFNKANSMSANNPVVQNNLVL